MFINSLSYWIQNKRISINHIVHYGHFKPLTSAIVWPKKGKTGKVIAFTPFKGTSQPFYIFDAKFIIMGSFIWKEIKSHGLVTISRSLLCHNTAPLLGFSSVRIWEACASSPFSCPGHTWTPWSPAWWWSISPPL